MLSNVKPKVMDSVKAAINSEDNIKVFAALPLKARAKLLQMLIQNWLKKY